MNSWARRGEHRDEAVLAALSTQGQALAGARRGMTKDDPNRVFDDLVARFGWEVASEAWRTACQEADRKAEEHEA